MRNAFLIIDPQNDFVDPKGSLSVPGASDDMDRLAAFISANQEKVSGIAVSLDTHDVIDISHPTFWLDPEGKNVEPFTVIKHKEAKGRKYTAAITQDEFGGIKKVDVNAPDYDFDVHMTYQRGSVEYLNDLEEAGKQHTIWPIHCVSGSWGHAIYDPLMKVIKDWSVATAQNHKVLFKGQFTFSEHYGIFEAEVPVAQVSETTRHSMMVQNLIGYLVGTAQFGYDNGMDKVYLCGEAKSHCVATSIKQILDFSKDDDDFALLLKKLVIVEDCMSPVAGFENLADDIFAEAKEAGVEFIKLEDIKL